MIRQRSFGRVTMFFLSIVLTSCVAEPTGGESDHTITLDPPESSIHFDEADAVSGIIQGSYDHAGHEIRFEAVRGELNPESEYAPTFAVDARLCDEHGFCFALGSGGHGITNASWVDHRDDLAPDFFQARTNHESAMVFHAELDRLDRSQFPGLDDELNALQALSNFSPPGELQATPPPAGYDGARWEPRTFSASPIRIGSRFGAVPSPRLSASIPRPDPFLWIAVATGFWSSTLLIMERGLQIPA